MFYLIHAHSSFPTCMCQGYYTGVYRDKINDHADIKIHDKYMQYSTTVKPVYKDHSRGQVVMVFVDRWSLCIQRCNSIL